MWLSEIKETEDYEEVRKVRDFICYEKPTETEARGDMALGVQVVAFKVNNNPFLLFLDEGFREGWIERRSSYEEAVKERRELIREAILP